MIKPSFINKADWECLIKKYKGKKLEHIVRRIEKDYPIQYAIGNVPFLNCIIKVSKNVLIPRFETELLVDKLIKYIIKYNLEKSNILDMCTGSGCIAICLKKSFQNAYVTAVDKSVKALLIAKENAKNNKTKIKFIKKDILKINSLFKKYSIIVSNPPYVKLEEFVTPNTKFEPYMALYPGKDDIIFYKKILDFAQYNTYKKNIIAFEIGNTQSESICKYAKKVFPNAKIVVEKDYSCFNRYIFIFNNCE